MRAIEQEINKRKLTQTQASKLLGVTQPRIATLDEVKCIFLLLICL